MVGLSRFRHSGQIALVSIAVFGCDAALKKDEGEAEPGAAVVTYADVKPILDAKCGGACHSQTGVHRIDLESYGSARISGHAILRVIKGSMPPPSSGITLTPEEIGKLELWGDSGFLEKEP